LSKEEVAHYDRVEDYFVTNGMVLQREAYVFRSIRIHQLGKENLSSHSIIFATPDPKYAWTYSMNGFHSVNSFPLLMVIRLPPGTPIMRTQERDEIILPYKGQLKQVSKPILLPVKCNGKGAPIPINKNGMAIHYDF